MNQDWLWLLFSSSFLSATLLPGNSEVLLLGLLANYPDKSFLLILVATLGNTLGGMSNYLLGRIFPENHKISNNPQITRVRRYGIFILLFSWLPFVGDAFCLAAGYLRFNIMISLLLVFIGKALRYILLSSLT